MLFTTKIAKFGTWFAISSLSVTLSNAQMTSETMLGLVKTQKTTVHGTVVVVTPALVQAGDTITGTVLLDPKGDKESDRKANQTVLEGTVIEVMGSTISPKKPQFSLIVPTGPTVIVIDGSQSNTRTIPVPILKEFQTDNLLHIGQTGQPITIPGNFDGDASNTKCTIGGQMGSIVVESPHQITLAGPAVPGPQSIVIQDNGTTTTAKINIIHLKLSAPRTNLLRGEKTTIDVKIIGLEGIDPKTPVRVSVTNESPETIRMSAGPKFDHNISTKEINQKGEFQTKLPITATQAGSFAVSGQLIAGIWAPPGDKDWPIDMDGMDTIGDLRNYSTRRLMDTLRDLRQRKLWDYVNGKKYQDWLGKKIKLIKGALKQRGVEVDDKAIDDSDF